jgi:predicted TIM-barrel fold metal-dependent hydrolase
MTGADTMHGSGCRCSISRRGFLAQGIAAAGAAWLPAPALAAPRPRRIDVHHHYFPPAYLTPLERWGQQAGLTALWPRQRDWSVARDLEEMDRNGVDTAILSISTPGVYFGDAGQSRDMARLCNDYGARLVADHPGRFGLFAVLPLPDPEACLREIAYAHDVLKAAACGHDHKQRRQIADDPASAAI